jgi:hypothetical protein
MTTNHAKDPMTLRSCNRFKPESGTEAVSKLLIYYFLFDVNAFCALINYKHRNYADGLTSLVYENDSQQHDRGL